MIQQFFVRNMVLEMGSEEQLVFRAIAMNGIETPTQEVIEVSAPGEMSIQFSTKLTCQTNNMKQLEFIYEWNELSRVETADS